MADEIDYTAMPRHELEALAARMRQREVLANGYISAFPRLEARLGFTVFLLGAARERISELQAKIDDQGL